jgi:hypothetical protein
VGEAAGGATGLASLMLSAGQAPAGDEVTPRVCPWHLVVESALLTQSRKFFPKNGENLPKFYFNKY